MDLIIAVRQVTFYQKSLRDKMKENIDALPQFCLLFCQNKHEMESNAVFDINPKRFRRI